MDLGLLSLFRNCSIPIFIEVVGRGTSLFRALPSGAAPSVVLTLIEVMDT